MLSNFLGSDDKAKEIKTSTLKVRGKTLIFQNSVYYIPNISVVEVGRMRRSIPLLAILLVIIGAAIIFFESRSDPFSFRSSSDRSTLLIIGFGIGGAGAYWIYSVLANPRHGLRFVTNSGESALIVSQDVEFLKQVALVIHNIMNEEMVKDINFNFDQRTIVEVGDMQSSAVVVGEIHGDLVNKV
ncbi:MAG: DUF6232 family protein [Anaerolineae bacterium]|nr:DUF6232 family protein [Anaerolineae bacterium]